MKRRYISLHSIFIVVVELTLLSSCQRSQSTNLPKDSPRQAAVAVPPDIQEMVKQIVHATETFDIPHILSSKHTQRISSAVQDDQKEISVKFLLPNPQGRGEMVRITIIAENSKGQRIGATTISKFVPGTPREREAEEHKRI